MANYGLRGGEIPDINAINQAIEIMNFHIKGNMVLNTAALHADNTYNTRNEFSFYQERNRLMLVGLYLSTSATPPVSTYNPQIYSAVDRTNASVAANYTTETKTNETQTIKINGTDYYLHFLKTEYTVTHSGDVWLVVDVSGSANKDFLTNIFQFAVVQYDNSVTLIDELTDDTLSDYTDWNSIQAFINSSDKISYSTQVFDYLGNTQEGVSNIFKLTLDTFDIETGNFEGYAPVDPATLSGQYLAWEGDSFIRLNFSGTAYSKGYSFSSTLTREEAKILMTNNRLDLDIYQTSSYTDTRQYQLQHVNFPQNRYNVTTVASQDALSSHHLFQLSRTVLTRYLAACYDGFLKNSANTTINLEGGGFVYGLTVRFSRITNAEYYMTLGNGEKYYFSFTTQL